jgi:hypothetical protein
MNVLSAMKYRSQNSIIDIIIGGGEKRSAGRIEVRIEPLELSQRRAFFREGVAHHEASPSCASTRSAASAMAPMSWGRLVALGKVRAFARTMALGI